MKIRALLTVVGCALAALALTACGNSGDTVATTAGESSAGSSASQGPSQGQSDGQAQDPSKPLPKCSAVWAKDADLPRHYQGCSKAGKDVAPHHIDCSSGQRVYVYANRFWAIRGHVISEAPRGFAHSKAFNDMWGTCRG